MEKCFGFTVDGGLNLNFFLGRLMSCSGGISGSTSEAAGASFCSSFGLSSLAGDVLSFSDLVGFFPGLYSHPMMDVKNFFLLTWNKLAISFCEVVNLVCMHLRT